MKVTYLNKLKSSDSPFYEDELNKKEIDKLSVKLYTFPSVKNVPDFNKIKMSEVGKFSISKIEDSKITTDEIVNFFRNVIDNKPVEDIKITDGTANAGGNTINFLLKNLKVNSIELNKDEFDRLKNNINLYSTVIKNEIEVKNGDCLDIIYNKKVYQDIIFFDPPWGGKDCKKYERIGLNLDDKDIGDHIDRLLEEKFANLIVLKGPCNSYIKNVKNLKYIIKFNNFYDDKVNEFYNLYFFCLNNDDKLNKYFNNRKSIEEFVINKKNIYEDLKVVDYEGKKIFELNVIIGMKSTETLIIKEKETDVITLEDILDKLKIEDRIEKVVVQSKDEIYDLISDYIYSLNSLKTEKYKENKIRDLSVLYIDDNSFNIFEYKMYNDFKRILIRDNERIILISDFNEILEKIFDIKKEEEIEIEVDRQPDESIYNFKRRVNYVKNEIEGTLSFEEGKDKDEVILRSLKIKNKLLYGCKY